MDSNWQGEIFDVRDRSTALFERSCWTDVTFAFLTNNENEREKKELIKAHKVILASASEYFEKMFYGSLAENTEHEIQIQNMPKELFQKILKYIYTNIVEADSCDSYLEILSGAKFYMLYALESYCVDKIKSSLNVENALQIFEFAELHDLIELRDTALKLITYETKAVIKTDCMNKIKPKTLLTIVERDLLETTELELFNAIESVAKQRGAILNTKREDNNSVEEGRDSQLFEEFRVIAKQIRFISMSVEKFTGGPAFSALLTASEALAITAAIIHPPKISNFYPTEFTQKKRLAPRPKVYFNISGNRIVVELRADVAPKAVEFFLEYCIGKNNEGFKGATFYGLYQKYCQVGAINFETKERLHSVKVCSNENNALKHDVPGVLGLLNYGGEREFVTSDFYILFEKIPSWNGKNLVIGKVIEGIEKLKGSGPSGNFRILQIVDCGEL